jgi:hypothetical protein
MVCFVHEIAALASYISYNQPCRAETIFYLILVDFLCRQSVESSVYHFPSVPTRLFQSTQRQFFIISVVDRALFMLRNPQRNQKTFTCHTWPLYNA